MSSIVIQENSSWKFYLRCYPVLDSKIEEDIQARVLSLFESTIDDRDSIVAAVHSFCEANRKFQAQNSSGFTVDMTNAESALTSRATNAAAEIWQSYDQILAAYQTIKGLAKELIKSPCESSMSRNDHLASVEITSSSCEREALPDTTAFREAVKNVPCYWDDKESWARNKITIQLLYSKK